MKIDSKIVEKAMEGDKTAFSDLYYLCYKDFYNFAVHSIGNPDAAADVVADVFVEIWRSIGRLRNPDAFVPWAFRILSIRCKKEISGIIRQREEFDFNELAEIESADSQNMEKEIEEGINLAQALSKLEAEERMILVLSVVHGYKKREIAEMIGKPQGTVRSKLFRTYAKLRKMMKQ